MEAEGGRGQDLMGVFSGAGTRLIHGFKDHSVRPLACQIFGKNMFLSTF